MLRFWSKFMLLFFDYVIGEIALLSILNTEMEQYLAEKMLMFIGLRNKYNYLLIV